MIGHHALIGATSRVSGAAAWSPADLGADLYTWNRHTALPTSGSIDTWAAVNAAGDPAITTATATLTARPTAGQEANGLRYASFDGVNDFMTFAGNPLGGDQVDFLGAAMFGLIWIDQIPLDSVSSQYRCSAFGADSTLNVYSGAASEDLEFVIRQSAASTSTKEVFLGGSPQTHVGGTSASPVYGGRSATQSVPGGEWVAFGIVITAARYDIYINSPSTIYASVVGAQNVALPIKYLGASYLTSAAAVDRHFKGRISEFMGIAATAADLTTRTDIFNYLDALKPA